MYGQQLEVLAGIYELRKKRRKFLGFNPKIALPRDSEWGQIDLPHMLAKNNHKGEQSINANNNN